MADCGKGKDEELELQKKQVSEVVVVGIRPRVRTSRIIRQITSGKRGLKLDGRRDNRGVRRRRRSARDEDVGCRRQQPVRRRSSGMLRQRSVVRRRRRRGREGLVGRGELTAPP